MKTRYISNSYPHLINLYRNEMSGYKRLNKASERALSECVKENEDLEARDLLALCIWRLVTYHAARRQNLGVEYLDLVQAGNEAALEAAANFNGSTRFATYATIRVLGNIIDEVRHHGTLVRVVRQRFKEWKRIDRMRQKLSQELGRDPMSDEIADKLDMKVEWVDEVLTQKITPKYFEEPAGGGIDKDSLLLKDIYSAKELGPEEHLEAREKLEEIANVLRTARSFALYDTQIKYRDGLIFCTYFGLTNGLEQDVTLTDIADEMKMTPPRISQICNDVLRRLCVSKGFSYPSLKEFEQVVHTLRRLEDLLGVQISV